MKDYYLVLGVPRSASSAGIRARYRDLARTLHPDVAGAQSTGVFQEVSEAYSVLADPIARRRHNAELAAVEGRTVVGPGAEPLAPRGNPASTVGPWSTRPSGEALLEHAFQNFTGIGVAASAPPAGLDFEVVLTPAEARRGVEVPIGVPRVRPCAHCGGRGRVWLFPCLACDEQGTIEREEVVRIQIPPLAHPRSLLEVPLHELGIHGRCVRLHVRIA